MDYLDTSYVLALAIKTDANHEAAVSFEERVSSPVISELVVAEIYVYYSQILVGSREDYSTLIENVEAMAEYTVKRSRARIIDVDINKVLKQVRYYAPRIQLKTLDLLHVLTAKTIEAKRIITMDRDIIKKASEVEKGLNIKVASPQKPRSL